MINIVLSHFDTIIGPKVFLNIPKLSNQNLLKQIPNLMDFYGEAFFIHEFDEFKTANLIFKIPSPDSRGRQESLMISIIHLNDEIMDLKVLEKLLIQFTNEIRNIKDLYIVFNRGANIFKDIHVIYKKIEELLISLYHSLPKQTIFMKTRDINLAIFDFFEYGISPIADNLRKFISVVHFYKNKLEKVNLFNTKLSIFEYSIENPMKFNNFLLFQLKTKDGFIFVVDESNKILFKIAKFALNLISKSPELVYIPTLILFNKTTTEDIEIQKFIKELSIGEDDNKTIKFISINTYGDDEIREAFNWIVDRIAIKKAQVAII